VKAADCEGCGPMLIDVTTRRRLPDDAPEMRAAMAVWETTTAQEREAMHRVTCMGKAVQEAPR
jgi:hypothetical protein